MYQNKKDFCFCLSLFILVLTNEMTKIAYFSESAPFYSLMNILEIPVYIVLLGLILSKKYRFKILVLYMIIALVLLYSYIQSGMGGYFRAFFIILASRDVSFKKSIRTCRYALITVFSLSLFLFIIGVSIGVVRRGYYSLGFVHPNVAGMIIMLICMQWLAEKGLACKKKDYFIVFVFVIVIWVLTGSRSSAIALASIPFIFEFVKYISRKKRNESKWIKIILCSVQPIMILFSYFTAKLIEASLLVQRLDLLFVNRVFLNYYAINKYGITLFGQNVNLRAAEGVYNNIRNVYWKASTVDCTYVASLVNLGLIPTLLAMVGYILIIIKALKHKEYIIAGIAVVLSLYAFMESHMTEIYNNFVYLYILTIPFEKRIYPKQYGMRKSQLM